MDRAFPEGAVAVFGGSGGIGKGVALEFAKAGTDVAIFYRSKKDVAQATAEEIRAIGRNATIHQADARSYEALETGFAKISRTLRKLFERKQLRDEPVPAEGDEAPHAV